MLVQEVSAYFSDFGVDATVGGAACIGIFDEAYSESFGVVSGATPILLVEDAVVADYGTAVSVSSRNFIVKQIEPDGTGFKRLLLEVA